MANCIGPGMWIRMHYTLRDGRGNLVERTDGPEGEGPVEWVVGQGMIVPGLERALDGACAGDVVNITVDPEEAYGLRDETDVFEVDKSEFPDPEVLEPGAEFVAEGDDGTALSMRVMEIKDDSVLVDANHPLAGLTLNYEVRVLEVRPATPDELLAAEADFSEASPPSGAPS